MNRPMPQPAGEPLWTQADVEVAAQAACDGLVPPLELMMRLGPNPPHEYLHALGERVVQMAEARKILLTKIVRQQAEIARSAQDYLTLLDREPIDRFRAADDILREPEQ